MGILQMAARLVTIPFSHYCEKARWALDRAGVDYREDPHIPMFAWVPALRAGRKRTVPVLVPEDDVVVIDSHDILRWVDRRVPNVALYPKDIAPDVEALESLFDRKVGPAVRRLVYHRLMKDRAALRDLFVARAPAWEIAATRALLPVMERMMKKGLKIDDAGAARSEAQLASALAELETQLAKSGGKWLFGDRFTAGDLTFASLMAPLVVPPQLEERVGGALRPDGPMRELIERHRDTTAGRFALSAYEKERSVTVAN